MATSIDSKISRASGGLPPFLQRKIKFVESVGNDAAGRSNFSYKRGRQDEKQNGSGSDVTLFDKSLIKTSWSRVFKIGPGLANLGNTCFLNSVLQSLVYSAPLTNLLLARVHGKGCRMEGFCLICELERMVQTSFSGQARRYITPNGVVSNIKLIGRQFRLGRQEDAHEFLRYVIESMQKSALAGLDPKLDNKIKETSMIHAIFGGHLQSKVTCHTCKHESCVYETLLDLSLEVRQANSVQQALKQFTASELLSRGNRYRCEACSKLTDASKQFKVHEAPSVLTVHLKRFQMTPYGMVKINRDIEFGAELDMTPFMSSQKNASKYDLYSVLVHEGQTCHSGHYHCFVKNSNGIWYSMNDESVHQVSLATVLKQKAYILFYQKRVAASPSPKEEIREPALKKQKSMDTISSNQPTQKAEVKNVVPAAVVPEKKTVSAPQSPVKKPAAQLAVPTPSLAPTPISSPAPSEDVDDLCVENIISKSMWHLKKFISAYTLTPREFPSWTVTDISSARKTK